ncbi:hypothetical protein [Martelella sp. AD-3]|uniref:hypothetical protein n=1 Tax=Martelella sp. AD-3 TaxID=686597 RepID=UPI000463C1F4|nr:hypothetical protein [Martelella sp. AD-3]AMM85455.1 hypothetical protein AZF01_14700 [Martelella sp. AD-3]MAM13741.1 hypothetical protein [Rhizobiaceae bacterium]
MNKNFLAALAGTAMIAVAGCSSTSGNSSSGDPGNGGGGAPGGQPGGGDGSYTVGGTTVQLRNGSVTTVADATGDYTEDDNGNISVSFTSGTYNGQSLSFSEVGSTSELNGQTATLEAFLGSEDDNSSSGAMYITVDDENDEGNGDFIALYSGDTISDLPQEGTGTYRGDYFGEAQNGAAGGLVSGSSAITVDFQNGAVSGDFSDLTIYDGDAPIGAMDDVGFSGTMDKNSAAYVADSVTIGGDPAGEGSSVKGSLFGGGASSTAGSVAAFDNADNPTKATIGVFQANRAD